MANVNDPNGFTPSYHMSGGTIRPSEFAIASGATGSITQASVGAVYTISTTAGDTNNGRSKEAVTTTTTSGIAKVVGFVERPDNSIGQYARLNVIFPTSEFGNN